MAWHRIFQYALLFSVTLIAWTPKTQASDICDYYRQNDPEFYKLFCSDGSSSTKPAGANSTFSDAFNINAGALPTEPSSYGLESIGSYLRSSPSTLGGNFALIKGFHKFGTGISNSSNNTFYGNDVVERLSGQPNVDSFSPHETAKGHFTNLNLGTSVLLADPSTGPHVRLGISVRYNNTTNTWGWGPGLMFSWTHFTLGAGFTNEQVSNTLPRLLFENFLASARFSIFEFEYNALVSNVNTALNLTPPSQLSPIHILTLTISGSRIVVGGSVRFLNYLSTGQVTQEFFSLQYMFSKHFTAGLLYNYIPGANSVGTQIFL